MKTVLFLSMFFVFVPSPALANFFVVSDHVYVNTETGMSTFTLEFSERPDFNTTDSVGRQANSFQYWIYGDESLRYPENYSAIIRGGELQHSGESLRIRQARSPGYVDDTGESGGWGALITEVPWYLDDTILSFSVSTVLLTSFLNDEGVFKYDLMSTVYGASTSYIPRKYASTSPTVTPVPLPSSQLLFLSVLLAFWTLKKNLKHQSRA